MNPINLLTKYYPEGSEAFKLIVKHSQQVTQKALTLAANHPEYEMDLDFIREASMLHDIGCFLTDAPDIHCFGTLPYIRHGVEGSRILRMEGFERHALVCERHTGAGISFNQVVKRELPLPIRDYCPMTLEEKLICLADKFFSKSKVDQVFTVEEIRTSMEKHGKGSLKRFNEMCALFL